MKRLLATKFFGAFSPWFQYHTWVSVVPKYLAKYKVWLYFYKYLPFMDPSCKTKTMIRKYTLGDETFGAWTEDNQWIMSLEMNPSYRRSVGIVRMQSIFVWRSNSNFNNFSPSVFVDFSRCCIHQLISILTLWLGLVHSWCELFKSAHGQDLIMVKMSIKLSSPDRYVFLPLFTWWIHKRLNVGPYSKNTPVWEWRHLWTWA